MIAAFLMGGLGAFDGPSRQAIFPHLIDRRSMQNAVALNSVIWQGTRIVGPAGAGVLIGVVGSAIIFYMTAVGFVTFVLFLAAVRMPSIERRNSRSVMRDMGDGLAFIGRNFIFMFLLGMTFFNSFFGLSYVQLLPVFQKDVLHVSESGLGLLAGMAGAGALAGTFIVAAMSGIRRKGVVMIGGAVVFGVTLVLFGYSSWFWISVVLVALGGLSSSIYMVLAQTTLQMLVPDQFRGRIMGIWGITYNLMPMGGFQAGMVASLVDARFAVALGGVAVIVFALLGAARSTQVRGLGVLPVPEVRSPS
jgi:MFS family permease